MKIFVNASSCLAMKISSPYTSLKLSALTALITNKMAGAQTTILLNFILFIVIMCLVTPVKRNAYRYRPICHLLSNMLNCCALFSLIVALLVFFCTMLLIQYVKLLCFIFFDRCFACVFLHHVVNPILLMCQYHTVTGENDLCSDAFIGSIAKLSKHFLISREVIILNLDY